MRAGHQVLRCHEPGESPFPCNALIAGRQCPLDVGFDSSLLELRDGFREIMPLVRASAFVFEVAIKILAYEHHAEIRTSEPPR